jgi:hypothetical protein
MYDLINPVVNPIPVLYSYSSHIRATILKLCLEKYSYITSVIVQTYTHLSERSRIIVAMVFVYLFRTYSAMASAG